MITTQEFWHWFSKNKNQFFFLNQIDDPNERERLLAIFKTQLHLYCNNIYFEIGGHKDKTQDLIITAEGNKSFFSQVEHLVKDAPTFEDWNIIAFKPPIGESFSTSFNGIIQNSEDIWFMPLENHNAPHLIGIRICFSEYKETSKLSFQTIAELMIIGSIGEKSRTLDIRHIEVGNLPQNPEEEGLIEFFELPEYIKWKKRKFTQ